MKIKIDTSAKTIQVEEKCKFSELVSFLKKIFPDKEWENYYIEAVPVIINWSNPIYIPSIWQPRFLEQPFTITCSDNNEVYCIQSN